MNHINYKYEVLRLLLEYIRSYAWNGFLWGEMKVKQIAHVPKIPRPCSLHLDDPTNGVKQHHHRINLIKYILNIIFNNCCQRT